VKKCKFWMINYKNLPSKVLEAFWSQDASQNHARINQIGS